MDHIRERFGILEQGTEPIPQYPNGRLEFLIFESPLGRVRLERITKPRTIGERALTSRRPGSATRVEAQYDLHDMIHIIRAQRWDSAAGSWVAIDANAFS